MRQLWDYTCVVKRSTITRHCASVCDDRGPVDAA